MVLAEGKLRIKFCFDLKFEMPARHARRNVSRLFEIGAWSSGERLELEKYIWNSSAWSICHQLKKQTFPFISSQGTDSFF